MSAHVRRQAADAEAAASRAAESTTADRLARAGPVARALMMFVIAGITIGIARHDDSQPADSQGALQVIAQQPLGKAVLALLAAAFAAHAVWRWLEAAVGVRNEGDQRTLKRLWFAAVGFLYAGLCAATVAVMLSHETTSEEQRSQQAATDVLGLPGGRIIAFVLGLALIGVGIGVAVWALRGSFLETLHLERLRGWQRDAVRWLGGIGQAARAALLACAGVLLLDAARQAEGRKAHGLDGTLRTLAEQPYGSVLLLAIAAGLIVFGVYSLLEAVLLRTTHDE